MLVELKKQLLNHIQRQKESPYLPGNFSLPTSNYHSWEIYEKEMIILQRAPRIHGAEEQYLKRKDGKHFKNACPHRGARLKEVGDHFVCSYHGWSFDQEGHLKSTTGHVCPYRPGSLKLQEMESMVLGGMVFTGESPEYLEEISSLSKECVYLEKREFEIKCNWKFVVESLLETYHFPFAHHSILGSFENAYYSMNELRGLNSRTVVPLNDLEVSQNEENLKGLNIMYFIYPYAFVLFMSSGFVWFVIDPKAPDRSLLKTYLFSYGADADKASQSLNVLDKILHQDFEVLEGQQANAAIFKRHCLTGYEDLIQMFHKNLSLSFT